MPDAEHNGRSHTAPEIFDEREHHIIECAAESVGSPTHNSILPAGVMTAAVAEAPPEPALEDVAWLQPYNSGKKAKKNKKQPVLADEFGF